MEQLETNQLYHIYNRANGNEKLFTENGEYKYFLERIEKYIGENTKIYAYCLLPNHFHFLLEFTHQIDNKSYSRQFSNCFNSYTKSINKKHGRMGSLFMRPFKRKPVHKPDYLRNLICYIHCNPVKHGYVKHSNTWKHSSYPSYMFNLESIVEKESVFDWFDGADNFFRAHEDFLE